MSYVLTPETATPRRAKGMVVQLITLAAGCLDEEDPEGTSTWHCVSALKQAIAYGVTAQHTAREQDLLQQAIDRVDELDEPKLLALLAPVNVLPA